MKKISVQELLKINNERKVNSIIKYENYPWSEADVRKSYYSSFEKTFEVIDSISGGKISQELVVLNNSYNITLSSIDELLILVDKYILYIKSDKFKYRRNKDIENKYDFDLMKSIYFTSVSIKTLVDHVRRIDKVFNITNYDLKRKEIFDSKVQKFLDDLRNFVIHKKHVTGDWLINNGEKGSNISINFNTKRIMQDFKKWTTLSKSFILNSGDFICIYTLFNNYRECLQKFYTWYFYEVKNKYKSDVNEYDHYKLIIKNIQNIAEWNLFFQLIKNKRDFYKFLNKQLTFKQIKNILRADGKIQNQLSLLRDYKSFINKQLEYKLAEILKLDK